MVSINIFDVAYKNIGEQMFFAFDQLVLFSAGAVGHTH